MKELDRLSELHFEEFLEICSDSGLIKDEIAREIINFAKAIGGVGAVPRLTGKQLDNADDFRTTLVSVYPEDMTFNNYVTTEENYYATEIARTIALIPRVWKSITPIMLHAHTGQGKTHLLAAIARTTHKRTLLLNTVDLHIEYQQCVKAGMDRELRDWITSFDLLLLDDIQFSQGDLMFQKFIISIINRMPRGRHGIITSSDVHPGELLDIDASFYSRLTSGLVIKLETVNLDGRKEILRSLFGQTGIKAEDDIIDFIATNVKLNVRQLKAAGRMVLAQMLGPSHSVTIDTVRDILSFMQVHMKERSRPKASELHVREEKESGSVTHSPYIVVDIDEEDRAPGEKQDPDPSAPALPEPVAEEAAPPDIDDEHIFREETSEGVTEPVSASSGAERLPGEKTDEKKPEAPVSDPVPTTAKYRDMVESAQTVENQVETLKQAVADRIQQLEMKKADSREIDKLRSAFTFLNEGKLEAAMQALRPE